MLENYVDILSKTALFHGIEQRDLTAMLKCLEPVTQSFNKNDYITTIGDEFRSIGILLKGEATISKENAAGNRSVMSVIHEGDLFGEVVAFSSQSKWPATVQAQSPCEVFFLAKGKILNQCRSLCPWHRMLIQNFLRILSEKALILNKKVEYLTIKSIRGKISTYLLDQYNQKGKKSFVLPLNRNELADFLNVSRPSLSREMAHMKQEGIIDYHLSAIRIMDLEALKADSGL